MDLRSGCPFWQVRGGLLGVYRPLEDDVECDAAVIGGGITGALVADHLVEAGLATVLLDKRDFGWGSTSASTALLQWDLDTSLGDLAERIGETRAAAHRDYPNAWFAAAYGGNGIPFGLLAAEIIRDGELGRRNAAAELFGFDRAGRP